MSNCDIIYEDFCNLNEDKFLEKFIEYKSTIKKTNDRVLIFLNLEGTFLSSNIKKELTGFFASQSTKIKATAFLGINRGVRKLILQSINSLFFIAEDRTDGEDWLLDQ